jgi:hypothetical protein
MLARDEFFERGNCGRFNRRQAVRLHTAGHGRCDVFSVIRRGTRRRRGRAR